MFLIRLVNLNGRPIVAPRPLYWFLPGPEDNVTPDGYHYSLGLKHVYVLKLFPYPNPYTVFFFFDSPLPARPSFLNRNHTLVVRCTLGSQKSSAFRWTTGNAFRSLPFVSYFHFLRPPSMTVTYTRVKRVPSPLLFRTRVRKRKLKIVIPFSGGGCRRRIAVVV